MVFPWTAGFGVLLAESVWYLLPCVELRGSIFGRTGPSYVLTNRWSYLDTAEEEERIGVEEIANPLEDPH
jgi:hypothetical protein